MSPESSFIKLTRKSIKTKKWRQQVSVAMRVNCNEAQVLCYILSGIPVHKWFSSCGLQPFGGQIVHSWGSHIRYPAYHIVKVHNNSNIAAMSNNENNFMVGGSRQHEL